MTYLFAFGLPVVLGGITDVLYSQFGEESLFDTTTGAILGASLSPMRSGDVNVMAKEHFRNLFGDNRCDGDVNNEIGKPLTQCLELLMNTIIVGGVVLGSDLLLPENGMYDAIPLILGGVASLARYEFVSRFYENKMREE